MKKYLWVTAILFGLLTVVHVWRMFVEPKGRDPWFVLITAISAILCVWALRLARSSNARS